MSETLHEVAGRLTTSDTNSTIPLPATTPSKPADEINHVKESAQITSEPNGIPSNPPTAIPAAVNHIKESAQITTSSAFSSPPTITTTPPPSTEEVGLFTSELVSPAIAASLPPTYTLRALRKSDYAIGFLDVLRVLTTVGDISEEAWNERYEWMNGQGKGGYYLLVIEDQGRIVGTGALLVERKFIHNLGMVGHIEDIAVAKDQQGKKLGLKLIQALDFVAEKVGCYKCILDCSEPNEGFYVKCGYKRAGLEMAHYYDGSTSKDTPSKKTV